jgi:hypothetical protein
MTGTGVDRLSERPLDDMVQTVSKQAAVVAREQVDLARREMTAKVRQASAGAAMLGGAGALAALASGTGTAALVLLLSGRPRPSAAALGVAGAYAGAGALLAREGLGRLREAGPLVPEETVHNAKQNLGSAKSAGKPSRRSSSKARKPSNAKRAAQATAKRRPAKAAKRAPRAQAQRAKRRTS